MSLREVVVLSGVRTAIADFGGSLKDVPPTELAGRVIAEAVKRSGLASEDIGHCVMEDPMMGALTCPIGDTHMGVTAENLAEKYTISREEQDELAAQSHRRAQRAIEENRFAGQILPIELKTRKGVTVFEQDEHVCFDCKAEDLAELRPAFIKEGTVTAANASGINDAAAALVLMEKSAAQARGMKPMARLVGYSLAAVDPALWVSGRRLRCAS